MKFLTILTLLLTSITTALSCVLLEGSYYPDGLLNWEGDDDFLSATIKNDGKVVCTFFGNFPSRSTWFNCVQGHYAWIAWDCGPFCDKYLNRWRMSYATGGKDYPMRVPHYIELDKTGKKSGMVELLAGCGRS